MKILLNLPLPLLLLLLLFYTLINLPVFATLSKSLFLWLLVGPVEYVDKKSRRGTAAYR